VSRRRVIGAIVLEQEVSAIVAYLWTNSEKAPLLVQTAPSGDAAKGKEIFDSVGCRACHVVSRPLAAASAPS